MSLALFENVPVGATETLFDNCNEPWSEGADLGWFLNIKVVRSNFRNLDLYFIVRANIEMEGIPIPSQSRMKGGDKKTEWLICKIGSCNWACHNIKKKIMLWNIQSG